MMSGRQADFDIAIVGAGLVGLAIGRACANQGLKTLVVERQKRIASETSARNSGVVHAGLYYPRDSLKTQLCVAGRHKLYDYAVARHIPHLKRGKLIVGADEARLKALHAQGSANGVEGLALIDAAEKEPSLKGMAALYSAESGVIDPHAFAYALAADFEAAGGTLALNVNIERLAENTLITSGGDRVTAKRLINAAGLGAHKLVAGLTAAPTLHLSKGVWCRVSAPVPFTHLIYPLPPPTGLGIHLTLGVDGTARLGPDSAWVDEVEYTIPADAPQKFATAVQSWWPGLTAQSLTPDQAGMRPRLAGPSETFADFRIEGAKVHGLPWLINLFGIESPGLTAALALADHVADHVASHVEDRL